MASRATNLDLACVLSNSQNRSKDRLAELDNILTRTIMSFLTLHRFESLTSFIDWAKGSI